MNLNEPVVNKTLAVLIQPVPLKHRADFLWAAEDAPSVREAIENFEKSVGAKSK